LIKKHKINQYWKELNMNFEPDVHSKEFLLKNRELAMSFCLLDKFATHDLCQDIEILSIANINGLSIAHMLAAKKPMWGSTNAAQRFDVLSIKTTNTRYSVAHELAVYSPLWRESDAAKNPDVLTLASADGVTVALLMARYHARFYKMECTHNKAILLLSDNTNYSVAHALAKTNSEWHNSPFSFDRAVLTHKTTNGLRVYHEIEFNTKKCIFSKEGIILRLINLGVAYKKYNPTLVINKFKINKITADVFFDSLCEITDNEHDPVIKCKMLVAILSTLDDLKKYDGIFPKRFDDQICVFSDKLKELIFNCQIQESLNLINDDDCQYGVEILQRLINDKNFSKNIEFKETETEPVNDQYYIY
jgi:hypothetical protein